MKLSALKDFILDAILPTKCAYCETKNEVLCDNCIQSIRLDYKQDDESIISLFDYQDEIIKKVIWKLKYHKKRYLGQKLGKLLFDSQIEYISELKKLSLGQPILVVPVPISKNKLKLRGYNQSKSIAWGFCDDKTLKLKANIIKRVKDGIPQAKIKSRRRRLENVKGVFEINKKESVENRIVFVIDDVTTTGGTIKEIMHILKEAKAKKVIGLTLAH